MAAPKDPEKKGLTLDLDIKKDPERKAEAPPKPQFKSLDVTVIRPENPNPSAPKAVKSAVLRPTKGRGGKARKQPIKINPIGVLAGALVAGFLLSTFIGNLPSRAPTDTPSAAPPTDEAAKAVETDPIPTRAEPPPNRSGEGLREANLNQLVPDVDESGKTSFAVRIKPKPSCMPGDMEAMRIALGKTGSVLLSLEPMAEGATKAVTRTLSLQEISEGVKVSLPVNLKDTGVYGIYLCGDQDGRGRCGGKPAAEFNQLLNFQNLESNANAVFYYQFAVLGLDYATVYAGLESGVNAARDELQKKRPKQDWKSQMDKAGTLMRGVKSLPPKTTVEGPSMILELELPMISPAANCG